MNSTIDSFSGVYFVGDNAREKHILESCIWLHLVHLLELVTKVK
jgi:hypothetical protein